MQELIDVENIPREYGGLCDCGGRGCRFESPEERRMREAVVGLNGPQCVPIPTSKWSPEASE